MIKKNDDRTFIESGVFSFLCLVVYVYKYILLTILIIGVGSTNKYHLVIAS